jgi:hypothetical protein
MRRPNAVYSWGHKCIAEASANAVSHLISELCVIHMGPPPDRLQTQMPRIRTKQGAFALPTPGRFPPCQSVQSVSHRIRAGYTR